MALDSGSKAKGPSEQPPQGGNATYESARACHRWNLLEQGLLDIKLPEEPYSNPWAGCFMEV